DAEGILDLEVGESTVRTVGVHEELALATEKATRRTRICELGVVEITFDASVGCLRHCRLVLRPLPVGELAVVARTAVVRADVVSWRNGLGRVLCGSQAGEQNADQTHDDNDTSADDKRERPPFRRRCRFRRAPAT